IAQFSEDLEGVDVIPAGVFGPFAGQLMVAGETFGRIRAIKQDGTSVILASALAGGGLVQNDLLKSAEEATFVPLNLGASGSPLEGFYAANYQPNVIKAGASDFTTLLGDLVVTGEDTGVVSAVHWTGSTFTVTQIGTFPNVG